MSPSRKIAAPRRPAGALGRLFLGRDVAACPECGEPDPVLGLFVRIGRGEAARLWRLEWITHAPSPFVRWTQKFCARWRRAGEFFVNHCSACGSPLADPLGFRSSGVWLCDTGLSVAVSGAGGALSVEGFSPGAVVLPGDRRVWEESLRLTPKGFQRGFRDPPRWDVDLARPVGGVIHVSLLSAPPPHRWRLVARGPARRPLADEAYFTFSKAKDAARVRWGVPSGAWRPTL